MPTEDKGKEKSFFQWSSSLIHQDQSHPYISGCALLSSAIRGLFTHQHLKACSLSGVKLFSIKTLCIKVNCIIQTHSPCKWVPSAKVKSKAKIYETTLCVFFYVDISLFMFVYVLCPHFFLFWNQCFRKTEKHLEIRVGDYICFACATPWTWSLILQWQRGWRERERARAKERREIQREIERFRAREGEREENKKRGTEVELDFKISWEISSNVRTNFNLIFLTQHFLSRWAVEGLHHITLMIWNSNIRELGVSRFIIIIKEKILNFVIENSR